ncbi:MAG TPA: aldehyde dehydrogenase family protein [Bdellovibrionales bacterium]|nr:aldehyde dehydrogenase family protein [Bdellovibrionales bacterium]
MKIINPATEKVIAEVRDDDAGSVNQAFYRARRAQKDWAKVPLSIKLGMMARFRDLVVENKAKLASVLTSEVGKPITQSNNELNGLIGRLNFFLDNTESVLKEEKVFNDSGMEELIRHEPLGVIANISAWNYPYFVGSNVFVPALLTGNTVIYKPSEYATLTGLAIVELMHQTGLPPDAFIAVVGGPAVGNALLDQPINGVFFTGSYATGRKINEKVAGRLMKVQLELGGKDPVYICDDVDPKAAAEATADGAFYNTGQSCCSVERIYVHQNLYDKFVEAFTETVRGFVIGDPTNEKTYIGPLARHAQLDVLDQQVNDAEKKGARLVLGGKRRPGTGYYYEPTVFVDANQNMALMKEESFGPIIGIARVRDDEEAVRMMNDTNYGLTAGVYTKDKTRAERILAEVNAGSAYWNCCDRVSPRLPWSGRGHSGLGLTLSKYGILTFTQPKAWHLRSPG